MSAHVKQLNRYSYTQHDMKPYFVLDLEDLVVEWTTSAYIGGREILGPEEPITKFVFAKFDSIEQLAGICCGKAHIATLNYLAGQPYSFGDLRETIHAKKLAVNLSKDKTVEKSREEAASGMYELFYSEKVKDGHYDLIYNGVLEGTAPRYVQKDYIDLSLMKAAGLIWLANAKLGHDAALYAARILVDKIYESGLTLYKTELVNPISFLLSLNEIFDLQIKWDKINFYRSSDEGLKRLGGYSFPMRIKESHSKYGLNSLETPRFFGEEVDRDKARSAMPYNSPYYMRVTEEHFYRTALKACDNFVVIKE